MPRCYSFVRCVLGECFEVDPPRGRRNQHKGLACHGMYGWGGCTGGLSMCLQANGAAPIVESVSRSSSPLEYQKPFQRCRCNGAAQRGYRPVSLISLPLTRQDQMGCTSQRRPELSRSQHPQNASFERHSLQQRTERSKIAVPERGCGAESAPCGRGYFLVAPNGALGNMKGPMVPKGKRKLWARCSVRPTGDRLTWKRAPMHGA